MAKQTKTTLANIALADKASLIPTGRIVFNPDRELNNERHTDAELKAFAEVVKLDGRIVNPIIVQRSPEWWGKTPHTVDCLENGGFDDDKQFYVVLDGNKRAAAAELLKLPNVPALVISEAIDYNVALATSLRLGATSKQLGTNALIDRMTQLRKAGIDQATLNAIVGVVGPTARAYNQAVKNRLIIQQVGAELGKQAQAKELLAGLSINDARAFGDPTAQLESVRNAAKLALTKAAEVKPEPATAPKAAEAATKKARNLYAKNALAVIGKKKHGAGKGNEKPEPIAEISKARLQAIQAIMARVRNATTPEAKMANDIKAIVQACTSAIAKLTSSNG